MILVAASGLAREVMAAIEAGSTYGVIGLLDDNIDLHGTFIGAAAVLGSITAAVEYPDANFVVCAGSGQSRAGIVARLADLGIGRDRCESIIHPSVSVPASCDLGVGTVLLANVVLTADVVVGDHVVAMPHAVLTHGTIIDDYATLCSGVLLGGGVRVGKAAYLGMGSSVREGVTVGEQGVLGMGASLLVDLPANEVWIGVPAKPTPSPADSVRQDGSVADRHRAAITQ